MNWDEPLAFALSLANQVGKQLVARRSQVTAEIKYDGSLVTEADIEADHLIRDALRARFPDHGIVSEELAHDVGDEAFQWVVDPIDAVSYTHLRAHETVLDLVCRLLLEKKNRPKTATHSSD